ncbi:hypothetical protein F66182_11574 [Fusarium sp. NRRL 66182]|nr:hypothetical protein F66182_11574 [Fusarium sp. NRRL 66182]
MLVISIILTVQLVSSNSDRRIPNKSSWRAILSQNSHHDLDHLRKCNTELLLEERNARRLAAVRAIRRGQAGTGQHSTTREYLNLKTILDTDHRFSPDPDEEITLFADPTVYKLQNEMTPGPYYSAILRNNGTIVGLKDEKHGARVSHVGQLFFDASLIRQVEMHYPYLHNVQPSIFNGEDRVLIEESKVSDPVALIPQPVTQYRETLWESIAFCSWVEGIVEEGIVNQLKTLR